MRLLACARRRSTRENDSSDLLSNSPSRRRSTCASVAHTSTGPHAAPLWAALHKAAACCIACIACCTLHAAARKPHIHSTHFRVGAQPLSARHVHKRQPRELRCRSIEAAAAAAAVHVRKPACGVTINTHARAAGRSQPSTRAAHHDAVLLAVRCCRRILRKCDGEDGGSALMHAAQVHRLRLGLVRVHGHAWRCWRRARARCPGLLSACIVARDCAVRKSSDRWACCQQTASRQALTRLRVAVVAASVECGAQLVRAARWVAGEPRHHGSFRHVLHHLPRVHARARTQSLTCARRQRRVPAGAVCVQVRPPARGRGAAASYSLLTGRLELAAAPLLSRSWQASLNTSQ